MPDLCPHCRAPLIPYHVSNPLIPLGTQPNINILFPLQRKSFVLTRSYRFVNIRLARTEYDKSQKLQGTSYNI